MSYKCIRKWEKNDIFLLFKIDCCLITIHKCLQHLYYKISIQISSVSGVKYFDLTKYVQHNLHSTLDPLEYFKKDEMINGTPNVMEWCVTSLSYSYVYIISSTTLYNLYEWIAKQHSVRPKIDQKNCLILRTLLKHDLIRNRPVRFDYYLSINNLCIKKKRNL